MGFVETGRGQGSSVKKQQKEKDSTSTCGGFAIPILFKMEPVVENDHGRSKVMGQVVSPEIGTRLTRFFWAVVKIPEGKQLV